jgi:hypothetical protein
MLQVAANFILSLLLIALIIVKGQSALGRQAA